MKTTIQIRDQVTCQKCGKQDKTLHVHHRHYLTGRDPWDYPEDLLVLICASCHKSEEQAAEILKEMVPALHNWGYFNTEIRDVVNKLIESKISEKVCQKDSQTQTNGKSRS